MVKKSLGLAYIIQYEKPSLLNISYHVLMAFMFVFFAILLTQPAIGQEDNPGRSKELSTAEIAKQLQNPVAALISVPFQNNFDWGAGPNDDGFQWKMNIQPVIPISISEDWNVIWRTILPVISQNDIAGTPQNPSGTQTGLGDTLVSFFLSPKKLGSSGLIWGVGPALYFPTGTDELLGAEKWGVGPTAVVLKQSGGWTYGSLANHIWSYAGDDSRNDISSTYIQPFLGYTTKKSTSFFINSESTYDWEANQWTIPINATISQLVKIGSQLVQFQVGGRWYADRPEFGPDWGLRFSITFLFPR